MVEVLWEFGSCTITVRLSVRVSVREYSESFYKELCGLYTQEGP